jgi:hypothetical protein
VRSVAAAGAVAVAAAVAGLAGLGGLGGFGAEARATTWSAAVSGDFSDTTKWTGGAAPGPADAAVFDVAGAYDLNLDLSPSTASLAVGGSNLTLTNATAGRTWALGGALSVTAGSLTLGATEPIAITAGAGSTSIVQSLLNVSGGSSVAVDALTIGPGAPPALVRVDGTGSLLTAVTSVPVGAGTGGGGTLTVQNGATAALANLTVAGSGAGSVTVQGGATASAGTVAVGAAGPGSADGTLTVTGADSSFTQSGATTLTVGAASGGTGTYTIEAGAVAATGTGLTTIAPTGTVTIDGGTFNVNGNLTVSGGTLEQASAGSNFAWATNKTLSVQGGGKVMLRESVFLPAGAVVNVSGAGSALSVDPGGSFADLVVNGGAQVSVSAGASVTSQTFVDIGTSGSGSVTVDGPGTVYSATGSSPNYLGLAGGTGTLTIRNNASALVPGGLAIGNTEDDTDSGTGTLSVQSGASLSVGPIIASTEAGGTGAAQINVSGGASITQSATATLTLGASSGSTASLALASAGTFTTGTGVTTVARTGAVSIAGGNFNINGDLAVLGGSVTRTAGSFTWAAGKTMTLASSDGSAGAFAYSGGGNLTLPSNAAVHIEGGTLSFTGSASEFLNVNGGASATATADDGGTIAASNLAVGTSGAGTVALNTGGAITVAGTTRVGLNGGNGTLKLENGATGTLGALNVATTAHSNTAQLLITNGSTLSAGSINLGTGNAAGINATITLSGANAKLTQAGGSTLAVGGSAGTLIGMSITGGASFVQGDSGIATQVTARIGSGTTTVGAVGSISITNGNASFGTLAIAPSQLSWTSGALGFDGSVNIAAGQLFGPTLTLGPDRSLAISGPFSIASGGTFTLDGGELSCGRFSNSAGTFNFNSGTLAVTNFGLQLGAGTVGNAVSLTPAKTLYVSAATTLPFGTSLTVNGGKFTTGTLQVSGGSFAFNSGTLALTAQPLTIGTGQLLGANLNLSPGRRLEVTAPTDVAAGGILTLSGGSLKAGMFNNAGEIHITDPASSFAADAVVNTKLLEGGGRIDTASVTNNSGGEVRVSGAGSTLTVTGAVANSAGGKVNLLNGASIDFRQGLSNAGTAQVSGGSTDVFGNVTNTATGKFIVTGNATATLLDDVTNDGEFRVSTGSTAVFFGTVTGAGSFTGSGTKIFEGSGSTVAEIATITGDTVIDGATTLTAGKVREDEVEIDGRLTVPANGSSAPTSKVNALRIPAGGKLDLTNNTLIVASAPAAGSWTGSDYTGVLGLVRRGRAGGTWTGDGIVTSQADAAGGAPLTAIGVAPNSALGRTTFGDLAVSSTDVLVMYTYAGDADLNGKLDGDDYFRIDSGFAAGASGWINGDFDYNGRVDGDDYFLLDHNLGRQSPGALPSASAATAMTAGETANITAVPEPAVLALPLLAGAISVGRHHRRRRSAARS